MIKYVCMLLAWVLFMWNMHAHADQHAIEKTRQQLSALELKIKQLQQQLSVTHDKKNMLEKELSNTKKHIDSCTQQLTAMAKKMAVSEAQITALNTQIDTLNSQYAQAKKKQKQHILLRYQLGQPNPLKWLIGLNEQNSQRLLYYHAYIMKARQDNLKKIHSIQEDIRAKQTDLAQELQTQQQLKQNLSQQQSVLNQHKQYQQTVLQTLQKHIGTQEQSIHDCKENQANLSRILANLMQEQRRQRPFFSNISWKSKFPMPVQTERKDIKPMNQGIVLFANEGASVTAVLPGKVVFTDWLKGYGYLLILDHGHGLMTLYAHNKTLFKRKGEIAAQGEKIAAVGHSGTIKQNGLYFEVRRQGKAVSPLAWFA